MLDDLATTVCAVDQSPGKPVAPTPPAGPVGPDGPDLSGMYFIDINQFLLLLTILHQRSDQLIMLAPLSAPRAK